MATGKLEIKYTQLGAFINDIYECEEYYEEANDHLQEAIDSINSINTDILPDNGIDLDNALYNLNQQMTVFNSRINSLNSIISNFNQFCIDAENYESKIANHLESNFGEFCEKNDIKVDDPDDYDFWDFLDDIGDGIKAFYEQYKYIVDVVVDAIILVASTAAVVIAVGTLMAVTGGGAALFFAVAGVVAAGFDLYEAGASLLFSTAALGCHMFGNEEEAQCLSQIRDDGAGEYVFVKVASAVPFVNEKSVTVFYKGMSLVFSATNLANSACSMVKSFATAWGKGGSTLQKFKNVFKEIFVPDHINRNNINTDAFDDTFAIWMVVDEMGFDPDIKTLENLYMGSFYFDQAANWLEDINDCLNDKPDETALVLDFLDSATGLEIVELADNVHEVEKKAEDYIEYMNVAFD